MQQKQIDIGRLWRRFRDSVAYYATGLYNRVDEDHIFLMAGGLSFSLIVCLIPLVLVVFSVLGSILDRPTIVHEISTYIDNLIPYEEFAAEIKEIVLARVSEFRLYKTTAGILGLVGLLLASTGLFSSMRTILNRVFRETKSMPMLHGKLRDFWLIVLVLIYFLFGFALFPILDVALGYAGKMSQLGFLDLHFVERFIVQFVSFVLTAGIYALIYFTVPETKQSAKVIAVSAVAAAVLWEIAKQLFGIYLSSSTIFAKVYGTYVFFVASAFWVYYSSIVFIVGAEFGRLAHEREPVSDEPSEFFQD